MNKEPMRSGTFKDHLGHSMFRLGATFLWVLAICLVVTRALGFRDERILKDEGWAVVPYSASAVIGDQRNVEGSSMAPYTIVEFGDYQCPFCRQVETQKSDLIQASKGSVRAVFRQFPLESLHKRALPAAVVAEAASEQGRFVQMHHLLMTSALDSGALISVAHEARLDMARAKSSISDLVQRRVIDDMDMARKLGVTGTPTFFLVSPDLVVRRFDSFAHLSHFVSRALRIGQQKLEGKQLEGGCGPQDNRCGS